MNFITANELFASNKNDYRRRFEFARIRAIEQGHEIIPVQDWQLRPGSESVYVGYCKKCGDTVQIDILNLEPNGISGVAISANGCKGFPHEFGKH
jgi:hypothetical protein